GSVWPAASPTNRRSNRKPPPGKRAAIASVPASTGASLCRTLVPSWHVSTQRNHSGGVLAPLRGSRIGLPVRRAEVRELRENVGVRLETGGGNLALGEEGEAVIDDVIGKNAAVGILRGLRRIEAQHVGQKAVSVDRGDCFFAGVIARMPHQV